MKDIHHYYVTLLYITLFLYAPPWEFVAKEEETKAANAESGAEQSVEASSVSSVLPLPFA